MKRYETILIFRPDFGHEEVKAEVKKIEEFLSAHGGMNISAEYWGNQELAYHIKKCKSGFYVNISYESEQGGIINELLGILRINSAIIKFETHVLSEKTRRVKGAEGKSKAKEAVAA